MSHHPAPVEGRDRDPVCGMTVRVDVAVEEGLVAHHDGRAYHFCRAACRDAFLASAGEYATAPPHGAEVRPVGSLVIDDGMRRWYESCSCCLSDAYPDVKAALDAERPRNAQPDVAEGICEVAEAGDHSGSMAPPPNVRPTA